MARVIALAPDLMLASRVEAVLGAAGHEVALAPSLAEARALERADLLVADLETEPAEALVGLGVPVLGYYSHKDVETRRGAEAAGVDVVVPRSRLARDMVALVAALLER